MRKIPERYIGCVKSRFVVWHKLHGVFLGVKPDQNRQPILYWSRKELPRMLGEVSSMSKAPLFQDREAFELYLSQFGPIPFPVNYQMQLVIDDGTGYCSAEECIAAGLEGWGNVR
jgi:hypothetical protein